MSAPIEITADDVLSLERLQNKITAGADVNRSIDGWKYPLAFAIENVSLEACRILLAAGAYPDKPPPGGKGEDPLWWIVAATNQRALPRVKKKAWIDFFVAAGAAVDGSDAEVRCCPLHAALVNGNVDAFEILVEAGADLMHARRPAGLHYSSISLMEYGFSVRAEDQQCLIFLLRRGLNDSFLGNARKGYTPFQALVHKGMAEVVAYYVNERGEDPGQRVNGRTLVQLARTQEMRQMLRSLQIGARIENAIEGRLDPVAEEISGAPRARLEPM
jgi:hypothetical protein